MGDRLVCLSGKDDRPEDGDWEWCPGETTEVAGSIWVGQGWWERELRADEERAINDCQDSDL